MSIYSTFYWQQKRGSNWSKAPETDKKFKYTGLEHRQTLRAWTSIVICKLKLKVGNLEEKFEIGEKLENWK